MRVLRVLDLRCEAVAEVPVDEFCFARLPVPAVPQVRVDELAVTGGARGGRVCFYLSFEACYEGGWEFGFDIDTRVGFGSGWHCDGFWRCYDFYRDIWLFIYQLKLYRERTFC